MPVGLLKAITPVSQSLNTMIIRGDVKKIVIVLGGAHHNLVGRLPMFLPPFDPEASKANKNAKQNLYVVPLSKEISRWGMGIPRLCGGHHPKLSLFLRCPLVRQG